jgi:CRP-like cAMP-binding protein
MIALGSVEVVEKHTGQIVTNLAEGSFFGEVALLAKCCRSHSVVAKTLSELNVLSKQDFSEVVKDYPRLLKNAWHAAKKRQRDHINRNKKLRHASGLEGAEVQAEAKVVRPNTPHCAPVLHCDCIFKLLICPSFMI